VALRDHLHDNGPVPAGVRCPTCGADHTAIARQSLTKRAAKIGAFGVFALASASKTFKCNHCGYTW